MALKQSFSRRLCRIAKHDFAENQQALVAVTVVRQMALSYLLKLFQVN